MSTTYNRVILVTGGNQGIGYEIVKSLAEGGRRVYLATDSVEAGKEAQARLASDDLDVHFVQMDVTSPESVSAAEDVVEAAEGRLDSLVNNAGVGLMHNSAGALAEPLSNIRDALSVNLFGMISVCQAFVPLLRRALPGYACIVNVTTHMGSNTYMVGPDGRLHNWVAYNTSKAAANSYTITLAKELEGEVKVNAVCPGFITTGLNGFSPGGKTTRQGAHVITPRALLGLVEKDKTCILMGDRGQVPW